MKKFIWNKDTKLKDIPNYIFKLMPNTTNLDQLDEENQIEHIIFRVQHEIDIYEEQYYDDGAISKKEYNNAKKFIKLFNQ